MFPKETKCIEYHQIMSYEYEGPPSADVQKMAFQIWACWLGGQDHREGHKKARLCLQFRSEQSWPLLLGPPMHTLMFVA